MVTCNYDTSTVSVLLGLGGGRLAERHDFATGLGPTSIVVGDINADSIADLVVTGAQSNDISFFTGRGDGTFGPRTSLLASGIPSAAALGDLNEDGKPDLVVTNQLTATVSVYFGNGHGGFGSKREFPTGVKVGGHLEGRTDDGKDILFTVTKIKGDTVFLDGNHPQAGKELRFYLKVTGVRAATGEEIAHRHVHGAHGHQH